MTQARNKRRAETGYVVKDAMNKGIVVRIDRLRKVPKYGKYVKRKSTIAVHDEKNEAKVGDKVEVMESRKFSKTKSWRLVRILEKGARAEA
jgi:small subunit ribosomal protein S17